MKSWTGSGAVHVRGTGFLGSSCQPGRRDRVHNNIGGLPRATVTSHAKISLPNTIRIMFSAIQMSRKHHVGSGRHDLILTEPLSHAINPESSGASNKSKEWQTSGSVLKHRALADHTAYDDASFDALEIRVVNPTKMCSKRSSAGTERRVYCSTVPGRDQRTRRDHALLGKTSPAWQGND